jgi:AraC-like DNA-binding protein
MSVVVCTSELAVAEREEAWRTAASNSFVPLEFTLRDRDSFFGEITGETIGNLVVSEVTAGPHRAMRTERHVHRSEEPGYYKLSLPTRGYVLISQDGREAPLIPGDLAIYDTSRPYEVVFNDNCRMLVLMFPHHDLHLPHKAMQTATARRVSGRHGMGGLISPLLVNLAGRLEEVSGPGSVRLADNVIELVATLYAAHLDDSGGAASDSMRTLLVRIKAYVDQHLDDADLGPEAIAAACFISTGYLHKIFRAEGTTVSRYVREQRLERCRHDLLDPGWRHTAVSTIGARWGFFDAAHFSRVFKAAYGVAPREYRLSRDVSGCMEMSTTTEPDRLR